MLPSSISSHASLYAACIPLVLNYFSRPHFLHAFPCLSLYCPCALHLECPSEVQSADLKPTHHLRPGPESVFFLIFYYICLILGNDLSLSEVPGHFPPTPHHVLLDIKPDFELLKGRSCASFFCLPLALAPLLL